MNRHYDYSLIDPPSSVFIYYFPRGVTTAQFSIQSWLHSRSRLPHLDLPLVAGGIPAVLYVPGWFFANLLLLLTVYGNTICALHAKYDFQTAFEYDVRFREAMSSTDANDVDQFGLDSSLRFSSKSSLPR